MAPRKPKQPEQTEEQEMYVKWAHAWLLCRDDVHAARGIGIPEAQIEQFLKMIPYSVEAQRIISEDATFIPDFKSKEGLADAVLKQLWKEARSGTFATSAGARVSALKAIADISGITNPEDAPKGAQTGGMLLIPVMKMDSWEKQCEKAQAALRAAVHE